MLQRLRHRAQGQEGFTLIELLVVILIIGILAGVAIPVFLNQTGKANDANVKSDINSAATAEETYYTDNQSYVSAGPGTAGSVSALTAINGALTNAFTTYNASTAPTGETLTITATSSSGSAPFTGYTITAQDANGITFKYTKDPSSGVVTRSCLVPTGVNISGCKGATANGQYNGTW